MLSFATSWGFFALARCTGRRIDPDQYSGEVAMDLSWSDQSVRAWVLPGHTDVADQWTGQPQLPTGTGDQPGPTVGCLRVAGADGGPAERLLEEAEGVLDREASQVPAPHHAQVHWQWTTDPGQPQVPRRQLFVGQALDLDADHAEGSIWRATHVELGPDIDRDSAVRGVVQLSRTLRVAIGGFVHQPKRLAMQARPPTAGMLFGSAIHHALLGEADQQVGVHFGVRQGLKIVATVERYDWTRCTRALGFAHSGDLLKRHLGRRLRRRSAALHVQRQHPTA